MLPGILLALLLPLQAPDPAADLTPMASMAPTLTAQSVRIGDLTDVRGIRTNALVGTGLVVGLNNTGDSARATRQALANLLEKYRLNITLQDIKDGSAALVIVTATLPPFAREGDRIDVKVSATGGAKSLFGGMLLFTPLAGADGQVYAVAQGPVAIGGFTASGAASSISQNHPTVGQIAGGATIEEDLDTHFTAEDGSVELRLRNADFTTAGRIADEINRAWPGIALSLDPSMVRVMPPNLMPRRRMVEFVAEVLEKRVEPHVRARVVINEKTGTIVAGQDVRISRVAIAHGNLTVTVAESPQVSQPNPLSNGTTEVVPRTDLNATVDSGNGVSIVPATSTIGELAAALNALGATPRDLITILQSLRQAGALHAELEVE